jgi:hypothetical protein
MARKARVVADGVPDAITQRGNNRQEVFLLVEDRRFCQIPRRSRLKECAGRCRLADDTVQGPSPEWVMERHWHGEG